MTVKKKALEAFLKPNTNYDGNQKNLRSIFIDKKEDDLKIIPRPIEQKSGAINDQNKDTIGTQLEHNRNTIGTRQEHNKDTIGTQQEHIKEHNKDTIGTQQEHIKNTNASLSFLAGVQRQLLLFLYASCKRNRSHITEEFAISHIAESLNIKLGSIKTSLRRLEEKCFIKGITFKKGRGGWTKFELPDRVYRDILETDLEHNWNTTGTQQEHNWSTQKNTNSFSSSINNINNKTTTESIENSTLFDHDSFLQSIHETLELLKNENVHLERYHIMQLLNNAGAEPNMIADSLDAFLFDIVNNDKLKKIKTNPVNYFMGIMRNTNHYSPPKEYKTKKQRYLDDMKLILENEIKAENELKEMMFNKWIEELKDNEKASIVDENKTDIEATTIANKSVPVHAINLTINSILKRYFNQNIFKVMENKYHQTTIISMNN
jgi:hypothetical protein